MIGIGCKDVVSYPGGRIGIRPVVVDVRSYEATNAQLGMLTCSNNFQSDAVIGMLSARMLEASSLLAYHYSE